MQTDKDRKKLCLVVYKFIKKNIGSAMILKI